MNRPSIPLLPIPLRHVGACWTVPGCRRGGQGEDRIRAQGDRPRYRALRPLHVSVRAAIAAGILTIAACGGGSNRIQAGTTATPQATAPLPNSPVLKPAPPNPTSSRAALTGLGLTTAAWNALHKQDASKNAGAAYDRQADGTDRFAGVSDSNGIITSFVMQYTLAISASAVTAAAVAQLPSDAILIAQATPGECQLLLYKSVTLGAAFAGPKIGDGDGYVGIAITDSAKALAGVPFDGTTADEAAIALANASFTRSTC